MQLRIATPVWLTAAVTVHRFEQIIAGRTYHIEVQEVSAIRWRAQIARRPGMPTSMMPFYGPTPEEAARLLANWLTLVTAVPAVSSVGQPVPS